MKNESENDASPGGGNAIELQLLWELITYLPGCGIDFAGDIGFGFKVFYLRNDSLGFFMW